MSVQQLQNAMALLIRLPDQHRKDFDVFAKRFALNARELIQLKDLSQDPMLTKYGRVMRRGRFDRTLKQLKLTQHFFAKKELERLCIDKFEPGASLVTAHEYTARFVEFLIEDGEMRAWLQERKPEYIFDVLRFEHAQLLFNRQLLDRTSPILGETHLVHRCFVTLELQFDVLELVRQPKDVGCEVQLKRRPCTLLMVGDLVIPKYRTFEINSAVAKFLNAELKNLDQKRTAKQAVLPDEYSDLVDVGICKPTLQH